MTWMDSPYLIVHKEICREAKDRQLFVLIAREACIRYSCELGCTLAITPFT